MVISKLFGLKINAKNKGQETNIRKSSQFTLEVNSLRGRIESEYRENFPNLDRFKDLKKEAQAFYRVLEAMIANEDHANNAIRLRDDLKKKLDALGAKIQRNLK